MKRLITLAIPFLMFCGICVAQDTQADYALLEAVVRKDYEGVKAALDAGANVDVATPSGITPLMWAVKISDPPMVRLLMLRGANRDLKAADGRTALDMAKEAKNKDEIIKIIRTTESVMPALRALEQSLKATPDPTPTPSPKTNASGQKNNDPAAVAAMFKALTNWRTGLDTLTIGNLLRAGLDPNVRDSTGRTPLMYAVSVNDESVLVSVLITNHADLDLQSRDEGSTALMEALAHKRPFSALRLLGAGAKTDLKDKKGRTAHDIAVEINDPVQLTLTGMLKPLNDFEKVPQGPPAIASKHNKPEHIAVLFKMITYRKERDNRGIDSIFLFNQLLDMGVNPDARNGSGLTPLMLATAFGDDSLVDPLIRAGADINAQSKREGMTALMGAALKDQVLSVTSLLSYKPRLDIKDNKGRTAYDTAAQVDGLVLKLYGDKLKP